MGKSIIKGLVFVVLALFAVTLLLAGCWAMGWFESDESVAARKQEKQNRYDAAITNLRAEMAYFTTKDAQKNTDEEVKIGLEHASRAVKFCEESEVIYSGQPMTDECKDARSVHKMYKMYNSKFGKAMRKMERFNNKMSDGLDKLQNSQSPTDAKK